MSALWVVLLGADAQPALDRALAELPAELLPRVIVVDDGSTPPLSAPGCTLLRDARPLGRGAAQRRGYAAALAAEAEQVVLLRGDGRHRVADGLRLAEGLDRPDRRGVDLVLGVRVGAATSGARGRAEAAVRALFNRRFHTQLSDLHSGALAVRADALRLLPLDRYADGEAFDAQLLTSLLARGLRVAEAPLQPGPRREPAPPLAPLPVWVYNILWPKG